VSSRREFLSNAFGIALVSATNWRIRADQARSTQERSNTSASKTGRTNSKNSSRMGRIRENRDTAPPGALLRSRRVVYGCRSFPPCDASFRSLYSLAINWMAESGIGIAFGAYFVNLSMMPNKHGSFS
jgi:hypothetical protein